MVADATVAALAGIVLGLVTGLPIGVVNVAIVDAATRGQRRFAIGIGLGGALADAVHAALAFVGVGRVVAAHPRWSQVMAVVAAIAILAYALVGARRREVRARYAASGVVTGLLLTLPNPAALGAWVAVAAALWPAIATAPALALAAGVGLGSALWFTLLARWIAALPADARITRALPRLAATLLVVLAAGGVLRAFS